MSHEALAKSIAAASAFVRARKVDLIEPVAPPAPAEAGPPDPLTEAGEAAPDAVVIRQFRGIEIHVDRPRGHVQTGTAPDGTPWRRVYHVDYGFIPNTQGGDGEGLDVFLGGDDTASEAHWILQRKADGSFDEYKIMLGFPDAKNARAMYELHIPKRFFGSMCSMPVEFMKALLGIEPADSVEKALDGLRSLIASIVGERDTPAAIRNIEARLASNHVPHDVEKNVRVAKAEPQGELRYVLGVVLEPEVVDAQGDIYSEEEIRKSAWDYMANFRNVGLQHKGLINGKVRLVESYIAQTDMDLGGEKVRKGTWMLGLHVADDEIWGRVKTGALSGLSIGGFCKKTEI